jgi:hypothetical protein
MTAGQSDAKVRSRYGWLCETIWILENFAALSFTAAFFCEWQATFFSDLTFPCCEIPLWCGW